MNLKHILALYIIGSILPLVFGGLVWYIIAIFIASIPLLAFTVKIIKKKFVKLERLGKAMLWYALLIFTLPWVFLIYKLLDIVVQTKSPLSKVIIKNVHYDDFLLFCVFLGFALAYLISGFGISKFKKWGMVLGILIVILVILLSAGLLIISLCGFIFSEGTEIQMMYAFGLFRIGPLVLFLLLCPNLLLLYCLTRPLKPIGDN